MEDIYIKMEEKIGEVECIEEDLLKFTDETADKDKKVESQQYQRVIFGLYVAWLAIGFDMKTLYGFKNPKTIEQIFVMGQDKYRKWLCSEYGSPKNTPHELYRHSNWCLDCECVLGRLC